MLSFLKPFKTKIDFYPEFKKGIDDTYSSFASEFEAIGNMNASKGYQFCVRINKYLGPYVASWIARHVVDLFVKPREWETLSIRYQYGRETTSKTVKA